MLHHQEIFRKKAISTNQPRCEGSIGESGGMHESGLIYPVIGGEILRKNRNAGAEAAKRQR